MRGKRWVLSLLLFASVSALGATYQVGIGDECDSGYSLTGCFNPSQLTINVGDTVTFYNYAGSYFTGPHNVVADDESFRCAKGCDDEGGDGTPLGESCVAGSGRCSYNPAERWSFSRQFNAPGIVKYHDEVSLAAGVIIVQGELAFALGSGITGTWFDPAHSGHGFMLEVLPGSPLQLLATWFVFAPQGGQSWVLGLGPISGNQAALQGLQAAGAGARFPPNLDAANVQVAPWGTLTFRFSDCNHGHVDWSSSVPGYGSGGMDLVRLTTPVYVQCVVN